MCYLNAYKEIKSEIVGKRGSIFSYKNYRLGNLGVKMGIEWSGGWRYSATSNHLYINRLAQITKWYYLQNPSLVLYILKD